MAEGSSLGAFLVFFVFLMAVYYWVTMQHQKRFRANDTMGGPHPVLPSKDADVSLH